MKSHLALALVGTLLPASVALSQDRAPMRMDIVEEVVVVGRTIQAVNFRRPGSAGTHLDFEPTSLAPDVKGQIDVDSKEGYVQVQSTTWGLPPAAKFGDEYMTYVLWAITPEGRATNLGEFVADQDGVKKSRLEVTTELQTFGMVVTAEPHFGVTMPSNVVVLEAVPKPGTDGTIEPVEAKFELLERGHYAFHGSSRTDIEGPGGPYYLVQARNARRIALDTGARDHAADVVDKAEALLAQAEGAKRKDSAALAKQAAQTFEDARLVAVKNQREAREIAAREDAARAEREAAMASARADVASERADMSEDARRAAEMEADAARRAAMEADAARRDAEQAQLAAEREKEELRDRLRQQFASLFETRETARGLILSMSSVLFDLDRATLRPEAREKLARLSGIVLTTPGLQLAVEGHADSTGSDEHNQDLSERRAASVREYLTGQGVDGAVVTSHGFGESQPIASNDTDAGRQQNRRVEIVVSGEVIGRTS